MMLVNLCAQEPFLRRTKYNSRRRRKGISLSRIKYPAINRTTGDGEGGGFKACGPGAGGGAR